MIPRPSFVTDDSLNYKQYATTTENLKNAPRVYEYFYTVDKGNAGPRFLRPTIYGFSVDPSTINNT